MATLLQKSPADAWDHFFREGVPAHLRFHAKDGALPAVPEKTFLDRAASKLLSQA